MVAHLDAGRLEEGRKTSAGKRGCRAHGLVGALVVAVAFAASGLNAQVPPPPAPPRPPAPAPQPPPAAPTPSRPGVPASAQVVDELRATLARAVQRFEARDVAGVLAHVSEQYRTGPLTKTALRNQLATMFQIYEAMRARVRIDEVRMVGDQAWVWSTGDALGQLPLVGQWMTLFWWERELEVARRENGVWRLYGYQQ
jgi:hypothetical protein